MLPLIEICEQNGDKGSYLLMENEWLKTHADFLISSCLNDCPFCQRHFFVFVEGEKVVGETPQELLEKTIQAVEAFEQEFDFL